MIVSISSDAEADLAEGYWFYERQSPGLGDYFRSCLIADIARACWSSLLSSMLAATPCGFDAGWDKSRIKGACHVMAPFSVFVVALLLAAACLQLHAEEATPVAGWTEDFNTKSWVERWVPYGRLADGTWAQGIEGHWPKGEKSIFARPEWWQLEEGTIRGTNFPDEAHAAGLSRRDKFPRPFQQTGVRVRCRLRLGEAATARIRIGGTSPGIKPDEATDNHVAVVDVRPAGIRFWNGNRMLVAEEPQTDPSAGVDAKPKRQFKNDVLEQVSDRLITPLEWHDVLYEVKQRDIRVVVDGTEALTYQLPHEQPIQGFSLEVDGDKRTVGKAWFDEVAVEPLPQE